MLSFTPVDLDWMGYFLNGQANMKILRNTTVLPSNGYYTIQVFGVDLPESGGQEFYIDALGVSWDPYYDIGDNLNEGILLNFESSSLEKMS